MVSSLCFGGDAALGGACPDLKRTVVSLQDFILDGVPFLMGLFSFCSSYFLFLSIAVLIILTSQLYIAMNYLKIS